MSVSDINDDKSAGGSSKSNSITSEGIVSASSQGSSTNSLPHPGPAPGASSSSSAGPQAGVGPHGPHANHLGAPSHAPMHLHAQYSNVGGGIPPPSLGDLEGPTYANFHRGPSTHSRSGNHYRIDVCSEFSGHRQLKFSLFFKYLTHENA